MITIHEWSTLVDILDACFSPLLLLTLAAALLSLPDRLEM